MASQPQPPPPPPLVLLPPTLREAPQPQLPLIPPPQPPTPLPDIPLLPRPQAQPSLPALQPPLPETPLPQSQLLPPQQQQALSSSASVTLRNSNGLLQYLPLRENFFKIHGDLKIVCQDGNLHWSSLLMRKWSRVAKNFCMDERLALGGEDKIILMMPEVKVSIMQLVLQWSLEGQVNLATHSQVGEVMIALQSLGSTADFSVIPINQEMVQDNGSDNNEITCLDICDEDVDNPAAVLGLVSDTFSLSDNSGQYAINQMNHGRNSSISIQEKFTPMDSLSETQNESLTEEKDDEDEEEIMIIEDPNIDVSRSVRAFPTPEEVPQTKGLPQTKRHLKTKRKGATKEDIKCLLCNIRWGTYKKYIDHLIMGHYKKDLVEKYIEGTGKYCYCPVCSKKMLAGSRDNTWKAQHLGKVHGFIFKVAQGEVRVQLETLENTGRFQKDKEFDSNYKTKKKNRAGKKNCKVQLETSKQKFCKINQKESNPTLTMNNPLSYDPPGFKCPLCLTVSQSKHLLKRHLATHHFRQEILRVAGISDLGALSQCPVCQKTFVGSQNVKSAFVNLWHLGRAHGYLDKVMPQVIAKKLKKM